jgi:hypothetical protein
MELQMARKPVSKPAQTRADDLDDDALYRVSLTRSIQVGRRMVAGENVRLRGDVLRAAIADGAVANYEADPQ